VRGWWQQVAHGISGKTMGASLVLVVVTFTLVLIWTGPKQRFNAP
jgi:hypothetical protein